MEKLTGKEAWFIIGKGITMRSIEKDYRGKVMGDGEETPRQEVWEEATVIKIDTGTKTEIQINGTR